MTEQHLQHTSSMTNGKTKTYLGVDDNVDTAKSRFGVVDTTKRLWRRLQFDEWTFTLLLFLFSSSIVLGKLFLNHDYFSFLDISTNRFSVPVFNKSHPYYKDIADKALIEPLNRYSWLIKAVLSGLATTGITWFIIYEDSNVPGVNPPSPFSPSKKRIAESPPLQINYLVGVLNGFLVFLYMCL
ncbi:uncharacterized protein LOC100680185 [Nasonia vitripennis]|uniref:Uncharacterized protein n=1 Tax=Nasonia vitripennis TaxID=7425 RepID=A0A7M7GD24_NASVI|nr:uncharacterized protein LOC100680185 [Nasonia vitripennis]